MAEPFLPRLRQGPLLCDGAMGTMLYALAPENMLHGRCFDELVLTDPKLVQEVHCEYIRAGAQVIETNSFGANATKLAAYGLAERVRQINRRAAQIAYEARDIAGQPVFVAGAVGPTGLPYLPSQDEDGRALETLRAQFREQIEALVAGGADLIILETFSNLTELRQAVLAARDVGNLPIVAQMTFSDDGQSLSGETPAGAALALAHSGAQVLGVNCSIGPAGTLDAVEEMTEALRALRPEQRDQLLFSAQPNAGLPTRVENRFLYVSTPRYFADYARRFAEAGVSLIGGCCGTTPDHIAAMREALAEYLPQSARPVAPTVSLPAARPDTMTARHVEPVSAREHDAARPRTLLQQELAAGRFVVSIEMDPPKGLSPTKILAGAASFREMGLRFVNVADSPMARTRMSCIALARLLQDEVELETIIHFTTRDRNLMAIQADLLGAHALGIRNILALTGDPVRAGNYPNLTGVWDVDSVGLLHILRSMNQGHDAAGAVLGAQSGFHLGAALNLNMEDDPIDVNRERTRRKLIAERLRDEPTLAEIVARDQENPRLTETELELHRLRHKLAAGAQYIMTQPIYDITPLERFFDSFGPVDAPLILGMIPLHSSKHAEFLHNEVPGVTIPEHVRARLRDAGDRGREVGLELAYEVITEARSRGLIQGCYLVPSYGRYDLVGELAQELLREPASRQTVDLRHNG